MIAEQDKAIITIVSQDIPLASEPFKELAHKLGMEEAALLERMRVMKKSGQMRKFSASLNHLKAGFRHNAMAVWNSPEQSVKKWGALMAACAQVSHCYQRKKSEDWKYNLYTMIHGRSREECLRTVSALSRKTGCRDYRVLFSCREFKKSAAKLT